MSANQGEPLSEREQEVLECLVDGASNRAIAHTLSISPNTVKVHLRNIYTKLGVSSRTEAVSSALQQGLLVIDAPPVAPTPDPAVTPETAAGDVPDPVAAAPVTTAPDAAGRSYAMWVGAIAIIMLLLVALGTSIRLATVNSAPTPTPAAEVQIGDSRWYTGAPLPEPRAGAAVAGIGLNIYQIGGYVADGVTADAAQFTSNELRWRALTPRPIGAAEAAIAVFNEQIYVMGGRLADGTPTAQVDVYSPLGDLWRSGAPLPQPVAGGAAVAVGGAIYFFGGSAGGAPIADAYAYNPETDAWRALPPLPTARLLPAATVLENEIYLLGGSDGNEPLTRCERFDTAAETWSTCPAMPAPRTAAGAVSLLDRIYVIGGTEANGALFSSRTQQWSVVDMPMLAQEGLLAPGLATIETRIYVLGGRLGEDLQDAMYVYATPLYIQYLPINTGGD